MSNTEFVMVSRAELVRLQENMDPHRGAVAWGIVCDLLAKQAEQHQGEPVALPARLDAPYLHAGYPGGWNACLDEITKLGPLYTHVDPCEAERLHRKIEHITEANRLLMDDCDTLRAQLDERDALLREAIKRINVNQNHEFVLAIDAALSASAEPRAPAERDERAEFEAAHSDLFGCLPRTDDMQSDFSLSHANRWKLWQARAALERKP